MSEFYSKFPQGTMVFAWPEGLGPHRPSGNARARRWRQHIAGCRWSPVNPTRSAASRRQKFDPRPSKPQSFWKWPRT